MNLNFKNYLQKSNSVNPTSVHHPEQQWYQRQHSDLPLHFDWLTKKITHYHLSLSPFRHFQRFIFLIFSLISLILKVSTHLVKWRLYHVGCNLFRRSYLTHIVLVAINPLTRELGHAEKIVLKMLNLVKYCFFCYDVNATMLMYIELFLNY